MNHPMTACSLAFAILFSGGGCKLYETDKANKKVAESNELFEEAGELTEKADGIKSGAVGERDPEKRKAAGKKCEKVYGEATDKLDDAEKLLDEAAKLNIANEFSEYLATKSKQLSKLSEGIGEHGKMCVELAKDAPDGPAVEKLVKSAKAAMKEAEELSDEAEDIKKKNPDKFKD